MQNITRRDFLKVGAASTAVLAIECQFGPIASAAERFIEGGRSVNRTSGLPRSFLPSTCMQCPAGCGNISYIEESRVVKIGGNPTHLSNQGSLCARGQAGINALYDPDRLLKPMKRAKGIRGNNDWIEISWEEAYDEIAKTMAAARSNPRDFVFLTDDLAQDDLGRRFTYAFGSPNAIGSTGVYDANKLVGTQLTWGKAGDMPDLAHSKYILVFGANPLESNPQFVGLARRFIDGIQKNQAKVVAFDIRLTNTSTRANETHYVNPGTYALLALSMANVIMQEGLYDAAFIEQWTNVSAAQLAQHLAQYTPERAEAETGVTALVIRRIATEFAATKPGTTISDAMLSNYANGVQNERAVMLLNIITGNIDTRGGLCMPVQYDLAEPSPAPPAPAPSLLSNPPELPFAFQQSVETTMQMIKDRKHSVNVLMTHGVNPVYSNPDMGLTEDVLMDQTLIPYHIAVTPYMNETAALADIILPETTFLEDWDIEVRPSPELVPYVSLKQSVVPAMESARSFFEITTQLAGMIMGGMEQYFAYKSVQGYLKARISDISGLNQAGGLDYLMQHGVWYDPKTRPNYGSFTAGGFATPSGKLEVYSQPLADRNFSALPTYEPIASFRELGNNEMVLSIFDTAIQTDAKTGNCMWLNEIQHDNPVWINPATAARLGIKDGDIVKLTRSHKSGEAKERSITSTAYLTEGIHEEVVAMANGNGRAESGSVAEGEPLTADEITEIEPRALQDPNMKLIWWKEKGTGIGINAKQIVPVSPDPIGGGQAWGDVVVTVAKA
ncbi:MAG: molybdopterin-dependent oxidoreductase [Thermoleophilia bacterium]|nr:molybdopterin-dependent oxidoreductase [Thermoleophilia bacterium]